jgi:hypothetical protein
VALICNPSYSGGRDWKVAVEGQPEEKKEKCEPPSLQMSWEWWYLSVVPAMRETIGKRTVV